MDARFINPVLNALIEVLSTMAQITPKAGKPEKKINNQAPGVVTGIIDLDGEKTKGSVAVSFSKEFALDLTKRMLRMELEEIDEQVEDLVGEMANMVAGGAKRRLEEEGFNFNMTLPRILAGQNHEIIHNVKGSKILLPFNAESGSFYVEICFQD